MFFYYQICGSLCQNATSHPQINFHKRRLLCGEFENVRTSSIALFSLCAADNAGKLYSNTALSAVFQAVAAVVSTETGVSRAQRAGVVERTLRLPGLDQACESLLSSSL